MAEDKRAETYAELARLKAESFYDRRRYDWKITLGFWALLVSTIFYRDHIPKLHCSLAVAVLGAVFLYLVIWLRGVWVANENDEELSDFFMKQAAAILRSPDHRVGPLPGKCHSGRGVGGLVFSVEPSPYFKR